MSVALLIIDMQKAFFTGTSMESMGKAVPYIEYILNLFREKGLKVIWIQDEDAEDGNVKGTDGFEIIDSFKPNIDEKIIIKHYSNSFNKTDLHSYLCAEKIDTLILTGYCAEYCVLSTYRGALDLDYTPIILRDSIASGSETHRKFVEEICEVISIRALERLMEI